MSDKLFLSAKTRKETGKKVEALRKSNVIPAVLYGPNVKNISLAVDHQLFDTVYKRAGESSLVDLQVEDKKPIKVLIQAVQRDPLTDEIIHIDFHQIDMAKKITTEVSLNFLGEAKAVKELGGILVKSLSKIRIECLPQDLVHEIEVDISSLNTFDDIIRVEHLKVPEKITVKEKSDEVVISVQEPRAEEELKALEEKPEEKIGEVEKVEEKEKEEKEGEVEEKETEEKKEETATQKNKQETPADKK